jgi:uncharacterized alkaline shock family protein YloU
MATSNAGSEVEVRPSKSVLSTPLGRTTIADVVVRKIAGMAAGEMSGVYELGTGSGAAKAYSAIKERIPGSSSSSGQGVAVEVGETQAAVDLDIVVEFGVAIADVAQAVRRNVISAVERMTGLEVTEVNVVVNDIRLPVEELAPEEQHRVQ